MTPLPQVKSTKLVKALQRAGFVKTRQAGSHLRLKHQDGRGVTVPMHGKNIPKGTLKSVLRQANLSARDLQKLL